MIFHINFVNLLCLRFLKEKMVSIIDIIGRRHSIRSFDGRAVSQECVADLQDFIAHLSCPFSTMARIEFLNMSIGNEPVHLGTYGIIKGTNSFLALINSDYTDLAAGYIMEKTVLHCVSLGLATCWIGGTVKRNDFIRHLNMDKEERLVAVVAIGYKSDIRTIDSLMRRFAQSDHRKPFEELFFNGDFNTPLRPEDAGDCMMPLQMLRLAPSASNRQPWRILKQDDIFHFFRKPSSFSSNDLGIGICHFDLTCQERNVKGEFQTISSMSGYSNHYKYVISWKHLKQ